MKRITSCFLLLVSLLAIVSCSAQNQASSKESQHITILWAEWAPAESLKELVKEFKTETGIEVKVVTSPWSDFQTETFRVWESKGADYDMVIGDSQWLGRGSAEGHYIELTNFVNDNNLEKSMDSITVNGYGEYPKGSKRYWAIPAEADAMGWAYRKDLFEDPKEKSDFYSKYGYELSVPQTWHQVRDIAEFFTRTEEGLYGIGIPTGVAHDTITMGFQNVLWAWGGDLGDYQTFKVKGILNSKESIDALKFYKELYKFTPPGSEDAFYTDMQEQFKNGSVSMFFTYFAFFPDLESQKTNPYSDVTGYFKMPKGPKAQVASLGGQGISLSSYTKKKDASFKFLEWFIREDTQKKWAQLGGFSPNSNVLKSKEFLEVARFNSVFAESMGIMRDFWSVPEYAILMKASQEYWNKYITTDEMTAEETMDKIAEEWESTFEYSGYYKE